MGLANACPNYQINNLIKLTGHPDSFGGPKNIQTCVRRSLPVHASKQVNVIGLVFIYISESATLSM